MAKQGWPNNNPAATQLQGPFTRFDQRFPLIGAIPGAASLAGITRVGGTPATLGSPGGSPQVQQTQPSINKVLIVWGVAFGILVIFHVGGARFG